MPVAIHNPPPKIFNKMKIAVRNEGEHVIVTIGNTDLTMHYEDALKISQMVRVNAKQAKHRCGDRSRHWSAIGILDG